MTRFHPTFLPALLSLLIPWPTIGQSLPLRIVSAKYGADSFSVTVQNRSDLAVVAFCISVGGESAGIQEFLPPSDGLAPGTTFDKAFPASSLETAAITCSVTSDGSVAGDSDSVAKVRQLRAGRSMQAHRLQPILNAVRDSSNTDFTAALRKAVRQISDMDIRLDNGKDAEGLFAAGMRSTNSYLLSQLRAVDEISKSPDVSISGLRNALDQVLRLHRRYLEAVRDIEN